MISKYADVSRVTIHKQFCSKEQIFRKVLIHYTEEMVEQSIQLVEESADCWEKVESLLTQWGDEIFQEIGDEFIRADLIYSAKKFCKDELLKMRDAKCEIVEQLLKQGIEQNIVSLEKINMTAYEVADLIELSFSGLVNTEQEENRDSQINALIRVYRTATS